ncbi:MAG: CTP synthase, partial [Deltaproteobacteria bacterium]|nr:CTP synthase [Deltaproteobacteria bacterium]
PPDAAIIEIGGTVGDIESLPFLEAIRQLRSDLGRDRCMNIHLTLVPYLRVSGELKTKPTQHSVKELLSIGIQPDIILCRCEQQIPEEVKRKIALFCNVDKDAVFSSIDVKNIYELPLTFYQEGFDQKVAILLRLPARNPELECWRELVHACANPESRVVIAVVGKYVDMTEAYKSLHEALMHGGIANRAAVDLRYVNSEEITADNAAAMLRDADGVLVPGGFGYRGVEGKIEAIRYARESKTPFFGICLGMQCAAIEFARNAAGLPKANSEEFDGSARDKVIHVLPKTPDDRDGEIEQRDAAGDKGASMRLGAYPCRLQAGSRAHNAYGGVEAQERHRHWYEFNNDYLALFQEKGMAFSGLSPDGRLVEIMELPDHPWFLGCQFHPEFKSNPMNPHPLFRAFIRAAKEKKG